MKQIEAHGFDVPIVVDKDFVVIKGHARLIASKKLKLKTIPVIVRTDLTEEQCKAARLADNKISELAEVDMESIKLELEALKAVDFNLDLTAFNSWKPFASDDDNEDEKPPEKKGDVKFSEYIGEANNYVVLVFKNEIDWLAAKEHFKIESAASTRRTGEPWSVGTGRVLDGATYLEGIIDAKQ